MDLFHELKKFKKIDPDPAYVRRSREMILSSIPEDPVLSPWRILVHSVQFGSAVTLAVVLLMLVLGGFSAWRFLSPFKLSSLDPASLKAEAQAIDIQIQLTKINYEEAQKAAARKAEPAAVPAKAASAPAASDSQASTSQTSSIEDVLQQLAQ